MKTLLLLSFLVSFSAMASTVTCTSGNLNFKLTQSQNEILINLNGKEDAIAVGLLSKTEVDVIARFPVSGEMTLFAKIGKQSPDNYLYFQGQHSQVSCR